jgi:hypothetical protein
LLGADDDHDQQHERHARSGGDHRDGSHRRNRFLDSTWWGMSSAE